MLGAIADHYVAAGGGGGGYNALVLANSPLAYYKIAEASGTTMVDSSGNARNGTYPVAPILGQTSLLTGDSETAGDWNGDYGEVASAAWMNVSQLTVECWARFDQLSANNDLMKRDDTGASRDWIFRTNGAAKIDFAVWNSGGTLYQLVPATTLLTATRYHIVGTFDGTNQKVYLNGSQIGTQACTGTVRALTQQIQVGGPGNRLDGIGQKFAIYGTALSAADVLAHYNAGI